MKQFFSLLLLLIAAGCEVLEEDISRKEVPIIAPANRAVVAAGRVDFRWSAVEDAVGYELTVVSPSFAAAQRVVIDTVLYADTLDRRFGCWATLAQGEYEWGVTGFNSGYTTSIEVRSLTVVGIENPE